MWLTDEEQKELLEDTTDKIAKGVLRALTKLRLATKEDVEKAIHETEKVWEIAERMDKRQNKMVKARKHALATEASQLPED